VKERKLNLLVKGFSELYIKYQKSGQFSPEAQILWHRMSIKNMVEVYFPVHDEYEHGEVLYCVVFPAYMNYGSRELEFRL
jgi:hypothetical protein